LWVNEKRKELEKRAKPLRSIQRNPGSPTSQPWDCRPKEGKGGGNCMEKQAEEKKKEEGESENLK